MKRISTPFDQLYKRNLSLGGQWYKMTILLKNAF